MDHEFAQQSPGDDARQLRSAARYRGGYFLDYPFRSLCRVPGVSYRPTHHDEVRAGRDGFGGRDRAALVVPWNRGPGRADAGSDDQEFGAESLSDRTNLVAGTDHACAAGIAGDRGPTQHQVFDRDIGRIPAGSSHLCGPDTRQ
jgi:hypothetical protein